MNQSTQYYAHSGNNTNPQTYESHVSGVIKRIQSECPDSFPDLYKNMVFVAALYHDIGKLDDSIQLILNSKNHSGKRMLNHVDAGVLCMIQKYQQTNNIIYVYIAWLIHAHHIGLQNENFLFNISHNSSLFSLDITSTVNFESGMFDNRNVDIFINNAIGTVSEYVKSNIDNYLHISHRILKKYHDVENTLQLNNSLYSKISSLDLRMMLSLLVEGDHYDTSKFYGFYEKKHNFYDWNELSSTLDTYVEKLSGGKTDERTYSRKKLYEICSIEEYSEMNLVDAPVGTGKTFSLLKKALTISKQSNAKRIFTILPFINIISQTVDEYKKSLNISDINEIHSKCEYSSLYYRQYSKLWKHQLNVSTSIQFCESLFSNHPASVRKLHNFCDSVVIIDEFHTCMPHYYWKTFLKIMKELSEKYNTVFILGSGSSVEYWNIDGISDWHEITKQNENDVLKCMKSHSTYFNDLENARITTKFIKKEIDSCQTFHEQTHAIIQNKSTLIVCNTIHNSYILFKYMQYVYPNKQVYNLSSAITPEDKEDILNYIKQDLKNKKDIIVCATSIVECGVDFSFDVGFRELASFCSHLQFNGRINRNNTNTNAESYIFQTSENSEFTQNPMLSISSMVTLNHIDNIDPENCSVAIEEELNFENKQYNSKSSTYIQHANKILEAEHKKNLNTVNEYINIINTQTFTILTDKSLYEKIKSGNNINNTMLNRKVIQLIYSKKRFDNLKHNLVDIDADAKFYYWNETYDKNDGGLAKFI